MKTYTSLLFLFILNLNLIFPLITFSQDDESPEEIRQREEFIYIRRAGGPGKIIPSGAYQLALQQKSRITEDKNIPFSPTASVSWTSVNPTGMFYAFTNNNYISGRTNSI